MLNDNNLIFPSHNHVLGMHLVYFLVKNMFSLFIWSYIPIDMLMALILILLKKYSGQIY